MSSRNLVTRVWLVCAFILMTAVWGGQAQAAPTFQVDIFSGHAATGDGSPFSGLVSTSDVEWSILPTAMAPNSVLNNTWYPYGSRNDGQGFGAVLTGWFTVNTAREYLFATYSDDGSSLYVGDTLVVRNFNDHAPQFKLDSLYLTPGTYRVVVNFYENGSGPSGVTAFIDPRAIPTDAPVPLPPAVWLFGTGLLGLIGIRRRFIG